MVGQFLRGTESSQRRLKTRKGPHSMWNCAGRLRVGATLFPAWIWIAISSTSSLILHLEIARNLPETRDFPPYRPGSPTAFDANESCLRYAENIGSRVFLQQFRVSGCDARPPSGSACTWSPIYASQRSRIKSPRAGDTCWISSQHLLMSIISTTSRRAPSVL
jgi:hypothetical protein